MRAHALAALFCLAVPAAAQNPAASPLSIELKNGTPDEAETRARLLGLLERFDVTPWLFTTSVLIDRTETPHSHPVLTLNTRYSEHALLATFLHEQMHWRVDERNDERAIAAMAEFRRTFPNAPGREGGGARDAFSSYLHLIVCDLELQVMTLLVGETRAREVIREWTHYPWVYSRVLEDPQVREVNRRHGFMVEQLRRTPARLDEVRLR